MNRPSCCKSTFTNFTKKFVYSYNTKPNQKCCSLINQRQFLNLLFHWLWNQNYYIQDEVEILGFHAVFKLGHSKAKHGRLLAKLNDQVSIGIITDLKIIFKTWRLLKVKIFLHAWPLFKQFFQILIKHVQHWDHHWFDNYLQKLKTFEYKNLCTCLAFS